MRRFLFETWEGLLIALRAIRTQKLRSILTTLGIIIGILAVTLMATVVNGIENDFENEISEIGVDVLYVEKWPWVSGPGFKWWEYINRPRITADLADVINQKARMVTAAVPTTRTSRTVVFAGQTLSSIPIQGVGASYPEVQPVDIEYGYFFTEFDARSARQVAVIGNEVAKNLFPVQDPLGKVISVGGHRVQVIGVMERKGSSADSPGSFDNDVIMPFSAFQKLFGTRWRDVSIQVKAAPDVAVADVKDEITGVLRVARKLDARAENDFEINEQETLRAQVEPIKTTIYAIGIGLTALALLVGGIGVMNIMFVSVKERTREIGIRKAVGARRSTILMQFLIEAIIVCLVGGLIGILLSLGFVALIQMVLPATLDFDIVLIAFGICMAIGTLFGIAPAWTGANAEPIEALRYE